jgi:hypothetical protein
MTTNIRHARAVARPQVEPMHLARLTPSKKDRTA